MPDLPSGTVTFLFTDVEGSTRLWEERRDVMPDALCLHDDVVRRAVNGSRGVVFATGGDGFAAVFARAGDAVAAAVAAQQELGAVDWPDGVVLRVRMGLNTGEAEERDGDYFGSALNRAARLMAAAHGGQIVCARATADVVRDALPVGVSLLDLGDHRLRDLSGAERVFQVVTDRLQHDFPPLRSVDHAPTNLPMQLTSFVGREREIVDVIAALDDARLVTLTGVGGVGKTRLALQVAMARLASHRDGVWFVELGAVADEAAVPEVVARSIGVTVGQTQSVTDAIRAHLESRDVLAVLDNCEHLLDAVATLIDDIARHCPRVRFVVTSREPIGVGGERVVRVASLATPLPGASAEEAARTDSIVMLTERALAVRPDFTVTTENVAALTQICRRLDGIPLAIELAAARLRSLTPAEIAARLDQRFRLLTGGSRTAADRHQTLRRTIDWSYELLDDRERVVLQRAAVFAGGFDVAAAEAVCATAAIDTFDVVNVIDHLVDKSLVIVEEVAAATRYRLLETIRDYALERLVAEGDADDVRHTHAVHFARVASDAGRGLRGAEEGRWIELVEQDLENLRSALTWALEHDETTLACDVVEPLAIEMLDVNTVVGQWAESIVARRDAADDGRYPQLLGFAAFAALRRGDIDLARERRANALELAKDDRARLRVLDSSFVIASFTDDIESWLGIGENRLELARRVGDDYELARALASIIVAHFVHGDDAKSTAEEALAVARRVGNPSCICSTAMSTAQMTAGTDLDRALALIAEAERAGREARNASLLNVVEMIRGYILYSSGNTADALRATLTSMQRQLASGFRSWAAGHIPIIVDALIEAEHDTDAAVLHGFWSDYAIRYEANYSLARPHATPDLLPDRLGAARLAMLMARGAAFSPEDAIAFARDAVTTLLGDA